MQKNLMKIKLLAIFIVFFAIITSKVYAESVTKDLNVKVKINSACVFGDEDFVLDFGEVFPLITGTKVIKASTKFSTQCVSGVNYSVALNSGLHFSDSSRHMCLDGSPTDCIAYSLYRDLSSSEPWTPDQQFSYSGLGEKYPRYHYVGGEFTLTSGLVAGDYDDIVTVTLEYALP